MTYQPVYADDFVVRALEQAKAREQAAKKTAAAPRQHRSGPNPNLHPNVPRVARRQWGLTPAQAELYALLCCGPWDSLRQLAEALSAELHSRVGTTSSTRMMVSNVRTKVRPFGVFIPDCRESGIDLPTAVAAE